MVRASTGGRHTGGLREGAARRIAERTAVLDENARYSVNRKALKRWADERLSMNMHQDGSLEAVFRYDGTTCTNMGRPLTFHYNVKLGPHAEGYPIREQRCAPAPGDTGHTHMCQYIENPDGVMGAIEREKPLRGERLNAVLAWRREASGAGCFCEACEPQSQMGTGAGDDSLRFGTTRTRHGTENDEAAIAGSDSGAAVCCATGRWARN